MPTSRVETMRAQVRQAITNAILRRRRAPWEPAAGRWIRTAPGLENLRPHFQSYLNLASTTRIKILAVDDAERNVARRLVYGDYWARYELMKALQQAGYFVTEETPDVVIHLFGAPVALPPKTHRILWIYSHPDRVTARLLRQYDRIFCASASFTEKIRRLGFPAEWLPPATAMTRVATTIEYDVVFVGNALREGGRPFVTPLATLEASLRVWGNGWESYLPAQCIGGHYFDYPRLGQLYGSARIAINDHHEDMRREGFVSIRVLDILAAGGFCISEANAGLDELFGNSVPQAKRPDDMPAVVMHYLQQPEARRACSDRGRAIASTYTWPSVVARLLGDVKRKIDG